VLPAELGHIASLRELNVSSNQVCHVPPELGHLAHLQKLNLTNNQLTHVPAELHQLTDLQQFLLSENPDLISPPPEIVEQGTAAILAFLHQV
jgi:Leucine-rich repeat (LRR) protein